MADPDIDSLINDTLDQLDDEQPEVRRFFSTCRPMLIIVEPSVENLLPPETAIWTPSLRETWKGSFSASSTPMLAIKCALEALAEIYATHDTWHSFLLVFLSIQQYSKFMFLKKFSLLQLFEYYSRFFNSSDDVYQIISAILMNLCWNFTEISENDVENLLEVQTPNFHKF